MRPMDALECNMMLLYGYFEDYLMKLSTGRGCVPVFNSAVKFFGSFKVFFSVFCNTYAKQKHPGYKKSARPIRSSIVHKYVRSKTLISAEAKKLLIKNLFNCLNDIRTIVYSIFSQL